MARKKKKHHGEEEGGEAWLLPYSDLMTLLLAVFIVLFAVSKVDQSKAVDIAQEFRDGMMSGTDGIFSDNGDSIVTIFPENSGKGNEGESTGESNTEKDSAGNNSTVTKEELEKFLGKYELDNLEELKSELDAVFQKEHMADEISTTIDKRGLIISMNNAVLFESGSADLKIENEDTLERVAMIVNKLDNYIRIEGHTDNVPISTSIYPSNWELSTARAASVVRLFTDKGGVSPEKVVAVGYGEYKPIADNSTESGRAKNRRIDVIVLSEQYNNLEK